MDYRQRPDDDDGYGIATLQEIRQALRPFQTVEGETSRPQPPCNFPPPGVDFRKPGRGAH